MSAGSVLAPSTASAVKNLCAIFETKHTDLSISPPSRGRSPNETSVSSNSSRQVSKVRATFVSVEQSDNTDQQQLTRGRSLQLDGVEMPSDQVGREELPLILNGGDLGSILKGSAFEMSNTPHVAAETAVPTTRSGSHWEKLDEEPTESHVNGIQKRPVGGVEDVRSPAEITQTQDPNPTPTKFETTKTASSIPKKSPVTDRKTSTNAPTAPSTLASKMKGGPAKIQGVVMSAKNAARERALSASKEGEDGSEKRKFKTPSVPIKSIPSSHNKHMSTNTRAPRHSLGTKLPSAATASTAASAARKEVTKETAEADKPKTSERRTTIPHAPRAADMATAASRARNTTRASLAGHEESPTKSRTSVASKPSREGLLARLTKPTASSASKAHDKLEPTSPSRSRNMSEASSKISAKKNTRRSLISVGQPLANGVKHEANDQPIPTSVDRQLDQRGGDIKFESDQARNAAPDEDPHKEKDAAHPIPAVEAT